MPNLPIKPSLVLSPTQRPSTPASPSSSSSSSSKSFLELLGKDLEHELHKAQSIEAHVKDYSMGGKTNIEETAPLVSELTLMSEASVAAVQATTEAAKSLLAITL